jgi:AraC-like DNA-binding protein
MSDTQNATIRAGSLAPLKSAAAALSLNLASLLRGAGLNADALDEPEARLPIEAVAALLEAAAVDARRQDFGLLMAQSWSIADCGPISVALVYQDTLREAVRTLDRHRAHLSEAIVLDIEDGGDHARLSLSLALPPETPRRQLTEYLVGKTARLCRTFLGSGWLPITAAFRHGPATETGYHRRTFGRDSQFHASFDGLVAPWSDLDAKAQRLLDPALRRHAEALVEHLPSRRAESIAERASNQIRARLGQGDASLAGVAKALGLTPRTLQRRLQAEGIVFSQLLDAVRADLAKAYLCERGASLGQIAERLGYADGSAFTRWFVEQFGQPPSRWRERRPSEHAGEESSAA